DAPAPVAAETIAAPQATAEGAPVDPPPEPRRSAGRAVVIAALTLLVLGGLLVGAYRLLDPGGERVSVPSIQGSTRAEAETQLREVGLRAAFVHRQGPDDDTRDTVVGQSPGKDAEVELGSTVTAEINVGPATTKIPGGLVGKDLDKALEKLADAGFSNVKAIPVDNPPEDADPDEVVAVDPDEGERAALEEDIVVSYVGRAAEPATRGPRARAPATKDRAPTEKQSEPDASGPAKETTRSSSPDDDETSTSDPTATQSSAPTEGATGASAPATSEDPPEESPDTDSVELPSASDVPAVGEGVPAVGESINP
ncbi:MAG TPA: PASTA domain-containing protein, partial [Propionibacteriaceae bacterium]|nr:PASTA domain-containing protein [Propionibacteriaceae bacterium]